jgi:hypothetical protein
MSRDDTIITSLIYEHASFCGKWAQEVADSHEGDSIDFYGRRMLKLESKKRIKSTDSDEKIAKAITPLMAWLFWQIAPELLLWIVAAIRKRIWTQQQELHQ